MCAMSLSPRHSHKLESRETVLAPRVTCELVSLVDTRRRYRLQHLVRRLVSHHHKHRHNRHLSVGVCHLLIR